MMCIMEYVISTASVKYAMYFLGILLFTVLVLGHSQCCLLLPVSFQITAVEVCRDLGAVGTCEQICRSGARVQTDSHTFEHHWPFSVLQKFHVCMIPRSQFQFSRSVGDVEYEQEFPFSIHHFFLLTDEA